MPDHTEQTESQGAWTIGRLLDWTTGWFRERGVEGGRLSAELLLARATGCTKIELYTRYEQAPTEEQRAAFRELVKQAGRHTPIAYLLGTREFFSLGFEVTPAVLIPRPETEILAERVIELCRAEPDRAWHVLDVGTGTGCVAVAIARYAANGQLVASDISSEALAIAGRNAERHDLAERIRLVEADAFALPPEVVPEGGFDAIVSNPPYISDTVWPTLPPHIREHEPKVALLGPGGDGLAMYRRFAAEAPAVLKPHGRLLTEIAHDQRDAVVGIFDRAGGWTFVGARRSSSDPHDRMLEFERA